MTRQIFKGAGESRMIRALHTDSNQYMISIYDAARVHGVIMLDAATARELANAIITEGAAHDL